MHRSPLYALVIVFGMAACSTRDATAATELLSKDATLVAQLSTVQTAPRPALPAACGAVAVAVRPAASDLARAEELARRGYDAETLGDVEDARSLLQRASELDGTNESAAYHLGRTNEALGDRAAAVAAYCRFLALTPTPGEAADAQERVARLSGPAPRVAAGSVGDAVRPSPRARVATPRRVARARAAVERPVVARQPVERSVPVTSNAHVAHRVSAAADSVNTAPSSHVAAADGDVVATPDQQPAVVAPAPSESRTVSTGPSRAQRAGIGAAAGAIIGAVTGRGVKGVLIGAAAGGVLGTVIGGRVAPVGRGIRP